MRLKHRLILLRTAVTPRTGARPWRCRQNRLRCRGCDRKASTGGREAAAQATGQGSALPVQAHGGSFTSGWQSAAGHEQMRARAAAVTATDE